MRLRSNPNLRSTRLVAVSGYAQPEDVQRATEAGFIGHISKPPDPSALKVLDRPALPDADQFPSRKTGTSVRTRTLDSRAARWNQVNGLRDSTPARTPTAHVAVR